MTPLAFAILLAVAFAAGFLWGAHLSDKLIHAQRAYIADLKKFIGDERDIAAVIQWAERENRKGLH